MGVIDFTVPEREGGVMLFGLLERGGLHVLTYPVIYFSRHTSRYKKWTVSAHEGINEYNHYTLLITTSYLQIFHTDWFMNLLNFILI